MSNNNNVHEEPIIEVSPDTNLLPGLQLPPSATFEQRLSLMRYMQKGLPLKDATNRVLIVIGVFSFDDNKRDEKGQAIIDEETGEVALTKTTVFLVKDGEKEVTYHTQSLPVYGWVKSKLLPLFGRVEQGDLLGPVPVMVKSKKSANGRSYHDLDFHVSEGGHKK